MPYRVNGIGTGYCGKTNLNRQAGICEKCGKHVVLSSYDTTLFFTVFFLPVMPLSKKHIIDYCPACTNHRVLPLKKWIKLHEESIEKSIEKYNADQSSQNALDLIGTLTCFSEKELFDKAASTIQQDHASSAEVIEALGGGYMYFDQPQDALAVLMEGMKVTQDSRFYKSIADAYMELDQPDQAAPYVRKVIEQNPEYREGMLYRLALCYQQIGAHDRALDVLNPVEIENITDKQLKKLYKKAVKTSEKYRGSNVPVQPEITKLRNSAQKDSGSAIGAMWARIAAPTVIGVLLVIYMSVAVYKGRNPELYIVNGLYRPYSVMINGQEKKLPSMAPVLLKLPEGEITVEVLDESLGIDPQTFNVETNFFSRPFSSRISIINPDKVAPVAWQKIFYYDMDNVNVDNVPEAESLIHTGQNYYEFSDIDYLFRDFPDEIDISSDISPRTGLTVLYDPSMKEDMPSIIMDESGMSQAYEFVKMHLRYNPQDMVYLYMLADITQDNPQLIIDALEPGLSARPVRTYWHRYYQNAMEKKGIDDKTLFDEYLDLLEKEPNNKNLMYLLGCVTRDPEKSHQLMLKSIEQPDPSTAGLYAVALRNLSYGLFDDAKKYMDLCLHHDPDNERIDTVRYDIYIAAKQYDLAIEHIDKQLSEKPGEFNLLVTKAYFYYLKGDKESCAGATEQWFDHLGTSVDRDYRDYLYDVWKSINAYRDVDLNTYAAVAEKFEAPDERFQYCITCSKPLSEEIVAQVGSPYSMLIGYIASARDGREIAAKQYLEKSIEMLSKGSWDERFIAEYLSGTAQPEAGSITGLAIHPDNKKVLLTACGLVFPQHEEPFFSLARKLNYDLDFPHLLIDEVTKK